MMGSGKTTVGKVLSEALRYSFLDWLVPNVTFNKRGHTHTQIQTESKSVYILLQFNDSSWLFNLKDICASRIIVFVFFGITHYDHAIINLSNLYNVTVSVMY